MSDKIDTVILSGHGKKDGERAHVPWVIANIEVENPNKKVEVILIFDAVVNAVKGNAAGFSIGVPFETYDLEQRMKMFMAKGGKINVCTPCLIHRNLNEEPILDGIVKIKGPDLVAKTDSASKILQFM